MDMINMKIKALTVHMISNYNMNANVIKLGTLSNINLVIMLFIL